MTESTRDAFFAALGDLSHPDHESVVSTAAAMIEDLDEEIERLKEDRRRLVHTLGVLKRDEDSDRGTITVKVFQALASGHTIIPTIALRTGLTRPQVQTTLTTQIRRGTGLVELVSRGYRGRGKAAVWRLTEKGRRYLALMRSGDRCEATVGGDGGSGMSH